MKVYLEAEYSNQRMLRQNYVNQINLEEELRILCEREGLDLHLRLERIKRSAEKIWALPRLYWFTDHSTTHSKRIVKILGQILSYVQNTTQSLTCHELYILLSACYLHDIGMQFFRISEKGVENFTDSDYERVRSDHPAKAEELIIDRAMQHQRDEFRVDLDDESHYFIPIAKVCKAHGSKFFDNSTKDLENTIYQPGGSPFRGVLLACLLMLADELDLHQMRANFPPDMNLSPMSSLHYHVHSYITGVNIKSGETEKERLFEINLMFPKDSEVYQGFIWRWLTGKLSKQIRRVSKMIYQETNGELLIIDKLSKTPRTSNNEEEPRKLPVDAVNVLIKEVVEFEMVNQIKPREIFSQMLRFPPTIRSLLLIAPDEKSEAESVEWLKSQCEYKKVDCYIINFSDEPFTINDLTQKMLLNIAVSSDNNENPLQVLIDKLNIITQSKQVIFVFQNFDNVDDRIAMWVYNVLLRKLSDSQLSAIFVISCTTQPQMFDDCSRFQEKLSWDKITQEDIEVVFLSYGYSFSEAQTKAMGLFASTGGKPENVIYGLEFERNQWSTTK